MDIQRNQEPESIPTGESYGEDVYAAPTTVEHAIRRSYHDISLDLLLAWTRKAIEKREVAYREFYQSLVLAYPTDGSRALMEDWLYHDDITTALTHLHDLLRRGTGEGSKRRVIGGTDK